MFNYLDSLPIDIHNELLKFLNEKQYHIEEHLLYKGEVKVILIKDNFDDVCFYIEYDYIFECICDNHDHYEDDICGKCNMNPKNECKNSYYTEDFITSIR